MLGYAGLIISFFMTLDQMEQKSFKAVVPGIFMIAMALSILQLGQMVHDLRKENNRKN